MSTNNGRVAVIDGVRTPFCKGGTALAGLSALDLGALCVAELLQRTGAPRERVDQIIFGQVVPSLEVTNVAREIGLRVDLVTSTDAHSVSRACTTSHRAIADGARAIRAGEADLVIAGGADSASSAPLAVSDGLADALKEAESASSTISRVRALGRIRPRHLVPRPPRLAEASTGQTMAEAAEEMAAKNDISREASDDFAHRSHRRAARAWDRGLFDSEVMWLFAPPDYGAVARDNLVRHDSDRDAYAALPELFDSARPTLTAGNSSPLTDGAACVLLASDRGAELLGAAPLGYLGECAFTAIDPGDELLSGPATAIPAVLERAELELSDIEVVDFHEAFAAQVLAVLAHLDAHGLVIDREALNPLGGSIAVGHPFAATGARQITQTLNELRRRGGGVGLIAACAAGGLAAAQIAEVPKESA